ncbi:MAG: hypothetical protein SFW09_09820 [Hyphomicrobiaceae bacterium]|nr:hypothetical protein [Hyphomicrobiaceae bacterium]
MSDPNAAGGILSVWNEYPADDVEFYERWYMTEHFPERLGVPGFLRGRRYRAIEADRTYFTFYELESPDVLFSDYYLARLNDPTAWTVRIMSRWSSMFRTVCRRTARAGVAIGGFVAVARFEGPALISRGQAAEIKERLADPGVMAVDLWQATAAQNGETEEGKARAEAERNITAAVIVETTGPESAARAKASLPGLLGTNAVPATIGLYRLIALQDAPGR